MAQYDLELEMLIKKIKPVVKKKFGDASSVVFWKTIADFMPNKKKDDPNSIISSETLFYIPEGFLRDNYDTVSNKKLNVTEESLAREIMPMHYKTVMTLHNKRADSIDSVYYEVLEQLDESDINECSAFELRFLRLPSMRHSYSTMRASHYELSLTRLYKSQTGETDKKV